MKRSEGEKVRLLEAIARTRALISGMEIGLRDLDVPVLESAQAVVDSAVRLVSTAAKLDAYRMAERDGSTS